MSCVCNLDTIERQCGQNAPGLARELSIGCIDDITTIPAATTDTHLIEDDITMAMGKTFFVWNFAKENQSYTSTQDENGLWKTEVKIFIPKMKDTTTFVLSSLNGENYVAVVEDRNGLFRVIGELKNGAMVRTVEKTDPKNGYEVTITWESAMPPYFYTGTIAV